MAIVSLRALDDFDAFLVSCSLVSGSGGLLSEVRQVLDEFLEVVDFGELIFDDRLDDGFRVFDIDRVSDCWAALSSNTCWC